MAGHRPTVELSAMRGGGGWVAPSCRGNACPRAGHLAPERGDRLVEHGLRCGGMGRGGGARTHAHTHTRGWGGACFLCRGPALASNPPPGLPAHDDAELRAVWWPRTPCAARPGAAVYGFDSLFAPPPKQLESRRRSGRQWVSYYHRCCRELNSREAPPTG